MSEAILPLTTIGVVLVVGLVLSVLAKRVGQNPVLGYILAGFLLGPFALGFLSPTDVLVQSFSELGLFVLLFYLGMELSFRDFVKAGVPTLGLALADMGASALVGILVAQLFGFSLLFSVAIGLMLFSTSSAIVGKFLLDRGMLRQRSAQMAMAILILQDFLGILVLVFVSSFSSSSSAFELALTAVVFAAVSFFAVHQVSKRVEGLFERYKLGSTELSLYALAIGLLVAMLGSFLKLSPALGAYFAGFALSELNVGEKAKNEINFSRDFFLLFFFVSFGASLFFDSAAGVIVLPQTSDLLFVGGFAVLLGLLSITVHAVVLTIMGPLFSISNRDSSEMAILLSPLGEFVIIIAISIMPLLAAQESVLLAPIAFLLIMVTLLFFQPLYVRLDWHDRLTSRIPAFAPRPLSSRPVVDYTPESIKWLKSLAKNVLLVVCLAWITLLLYKQIPSLGIPVPWGREITAVILFGFLAFVPLSKSWRALRKLWHSSCSNPLHHHPNGGRGF